MTFCICMSFKPLAGRCWGVKSGPLSSQKLLAADSKNLRTTEKYKTWEQTLQPVCWVICWFAFKSFPCPSFASSISWTLLPSGFWFGLVNKNHWRDWRTDRRRKPGFYPFSSVFQTWALARPVSQAWFLLPTGNLCYPWAPVDGCDSWVLINPIILFIPLVLLAVVVNSSCCLIGLWFFPTFNTIVSSSPY